MAAAAEVQVGAGYINGILGSITMTGIASFNTANRDLTDNFKMEEITSQNGAVIETVIASAGYREYTMEFAPKGTSRAIAQSVASSLFGILPLALITVASSTVAIWNGSYNYVGGASLKETRDGVAICNIKLKQYQTAADGTAFAALALVT